MQANDRPAILTVGHSTRALEDFIAMLQAHGVTRLVDVRSTPGSRRNPQFNRETLPAGLAKAGIGYSHLPGLGGRRTARPDSRNTVWKNAGFRGYADYMETPAFEAGLDELAALAGHDRVAIMCAEALPWRCHRSMIADALLARGYPVEDILTETRRSPHELPSFARIEEDHVVYRSEAEPKSDRGD